VTGHIDGRRPSDTTPPLVSPLPGRDEPGHLATGWEPHRPVGDGLVRRFLHAYASSFASPVSLVGGHVVRRPGTVVWDLGRPSGLWNGAMLLQPLSQADAEQELAELTADLVPDGTGEVVLFSAWPTPDLRRLGWQLTGHPPLLLAPRGGPAPAVPPWLDVVAVRDAATLADWERVAVEGYPFEDCLPWRAGQLVDARVLDDPRLHAWVGYVDGVPAAIGTAYVAHDVVVFTLGVTRPEHRGRGAWEVLARQRLAIRPDLPAMGLFSDLSRGPAERLGFLPLARWTVWTRARP
jgi:hypothetical protein